MAKLPSQRRLSREDFTEAPQWFDKAIGILSGFMNDVYEALNQSLTFTENVNSMIKTFRITAGAASTNNTFTFTHTLKKKPDGVIPLQVTEVSGNYVPVANAVTLSWRLNESQQIVIDAITGLTNTSIYDLKILII